MCCGQNWPPWRGWGTWALSWWVPDRERGFALTVLTYSVHRLWQNENSSFDRLITNDLVNLIIAGKSTMKPVSHSHIVFSALHFGLCFVALANQDEIKCDKSNTEEESFLKKGEGRSCRVSDVKRVPLYDSRAEKIFQPRPPAQESFHTNMAEKAIHLLKSKPWWTWVLSHLHYRSHEDDSTTFMLWKTTMNEITRLLPKRM